MFGKIYCFPWRRVYWDFDLLSEGISVDLMLLVVLSINPVEGVSVSVG